MRARDGVLVPSSAARRRGRRSLGGGATLGLALGLMVLWGEPAHPGDAETARWLVAFESLSKQTVQELANASTLQVRWVEPGIVVAVTSDPEILPPHWGARTVGRLGAGEQLGILRAADWAAAKPQQGRALAAFVNAAIRGTVGGPEVRRVLLGAAPGTWPQDAVGCGGLIVLAPRRADPRTLLDEGPPQALAAWALTPPRLGDAGRQVLTAVSADSIEAYYDALRLDPLGGAADRWVFGTDLDALYSPRIATRMQGFLQGIAGAAVERHAFPMRRRPPGQPTGPAIVDSTYSVVGRLPGTQPGLGTFVVCGHIDATGSRDPNWESSTQMGLPVRTPGAEDNATGVACVLEALRCIADAVRTGSVSFAFDLEFIAFSGEEVSGLEDGLQGSEAYVADRVAAGIPLLGAINLDMVGSDSLGSNLQIVHNPASRWMADFITTAASQAVPVPGLTLQPELDTSLASDHNSFWAVNTDAVLLSDAPIDILRRYASYHRPRDVGDDVQLARLPEVVRVLLATLLRFDLGTAESPQLLLPAEKLRLIRTVQGTDLQWSPDFRVWPGAPFKSAVALYSVGSTYTGPVSVAMTLHNAAGSRTVFQVDENRTAPPGARLDYILDPVPLTAADAGWNRLEVRVTTDTGGGPQVQSAADSFYVDVQEAFQVTLRPNPVRDLDLARVVVDLDEPGELEIAVYNLEGERVATHRETVQPFIQVANATREVPVLAAGAPAPALGSGTYFVRVLWTGSNGRHRQAMVPMAVLR